MDRCIRLRSKVARGALALFSGFSTCASPWMIATARGQAGGFPGFTDQGCPA